jgi:hypothetical protein
LNVALLEFGGGAKRKGEKGKKGTAHPPLLLFLLSFLGAAGNVLTLNV